MVFIEFSVILQATFLSVILLFRIALHCELVTNTVRLSKHLLLLLLERIRKRISVVVVVVIIIIIVILACFCFASWAAFVIRI